MKGDAVTQVKLMGLYGVGVVSFASITLVGVAVLTGFKTAGIWETANCTAIPTNVYCTWNTTVNLFIAGLTIFGSFMTIVSLSLIGKVIIGLFKNN